MASQRKIELLAPARNELVAVDAINHGADAVYIGPENFGARAAAGNSTDSIARVADYAHKFNARVYATVNTLIYENELAAAERLIRQLYRAGVDALIVQDMAILRLDIPPIELHASTQCDIRTPEKARFMADVGFSQLVLPRELTVDEIAQMHTAVDVPLEVFVHGALCVSYSGDCQASFMTTGRSANRGECSQVCRLPFDLIDGEGRTLMRGKHLLSLRDLNLSSRLSQLLDAGASSFKIEGRLKDAGYVKNIVAYYRQLLDKILEANPEKYARSSVGKSVISFTPDPTRSFNRGFTTYFSTGERPKLKMAGFDTPKSTGLPVAKVVRQERGFIVAQLDAKLSNGDGLGYFAPDGQFAGFRLNRVEGKKLFPAGKLPALRPGTILYRNSDKQFDDQLNGTTATRTIPISFTLRRAGSTLVLDVADIARGAYASACVEVDVFQESRTPQQQHRHDILARLGGTIYTLAEIDDRLGSLFVAASKLTVLRRQALEALETSASCIRRLTIRRTEDTAAQAPKQLSRHDNVANSAARRFYADHGTTAIEPATEVAPPTDKKLTVMTTRYCLRRELGACLRSPEGARLKSPLTLVHGADRFSLEFDCTNCRMHLLKCRP
ncbi:MAG: U32 family peptidase [Muribaculum sp.]|nr:U32 family peptidase [Muribaculaceae bacterium]MCM1080151.1 U32 family peptidase [Muribaculum sp.]